MARLVRVKTKMCYKGMSQALDNEYAKNLGQVIIYDSNNNHGYVQGKSSPIAGSIASRHLHGKDDFNFRHFVFAIPRQSRCVHDN